jgi:hypothetical protein
MIMKMMKTRLITRAIAPPSNRSRTTDTTSTRVPAAATPCSARATSSHSKLLTIPHSKAKAA